MGCDIHLFVEVKIDDIWHNYNHPQVDRHYELFAMMANVRNLGNPVIPISKPRGLPTDVTKIVHREFVWDGGDAHSASWLSIDEFAELEQDSRFGYLFGNSFTGFRKHRDEYPPWIQDVRIVFWFDN